MSTDYFEDVIFDNPIDDTQNLRIVALVDRPDWLVQFESGSIVVSLRDKASTTPKKEKKSIVKSLAEKVARPKDSSDGAAKDSDPSPYSIHVSALRVNRGSPEEIGQWSFSGLLKPTGTFHMRTDAILESVRDGAPSFIVLTIRVRSRRSLKLENLNTSQACLDIGDASYELVSKEILALHSRFFDAFYYRGFAEAGMKGPIKMRPLAGEDPKDYEEGMSLLLGYVHHGDLDRVTPYNVFLLLQLAERYEFTGLTRKIERRLIEYCEENQTPVDWEATLLAADQYHLSKVMTKVVSMYRKPDQICQLQSRIRGRISASLFESIFTNFKLRIADATLNRTCHLFFRFHEGQTIVQLNRARLPKTITRLVDHFSGYKHDSPHFYWNDVRSGRQTVFTSHSIEKNRLVSAEPAPLSLWTGEEASKKTVPEDAWALVLKKSSDGRSRLMLAKDRPDGVYLGFAVTRTSLLKGERCLATGIYNFDV